jgi:pimeloyl-ACP methyl ester carboxylesterase
MAGSGPFLLGVLAHRALGEWSVGLGRFFNVFTNLPGAGFRYLSRLVVAGSAVVSAAAVLGAPPAATASPAIAAPVPQLAWHPCVDPAQGGFDCATMQVPLDYAQPSGATISLAVIMHPASDPGHRIGTLFWDPGGPGASGTKFLPQLLDKAFPAELVARFDIASWDPRGVGASTAVQCFATPADETQFFEGGPSRSVGGFPVGQAQMVSWIGRYRLFGQLCQSRDAWLLQHVSTADTARDLDLLRQAVGDATLNYIGTSYGTFLGATYANLFPSQVRAMVLDGDINPTAWADPPIPADGMLLSGGLRQGADEGSAQALAAFLDQCGLLSTVRCAFSAGSPAATQAKFAALLRRMPISPTGGQMSYAEVVSSTVVALYSLSGWSAQASLLQKLWIKVTTGDGDGATTPGLPAAPTQANGPYSGEEQELAIACAESPSPPPNAFAAINVFAENRSGVVGPYWAWDYEPCATWPVKSTDRYSGPWNRYTANPVLVIGTTFDPATPYASAVAMASQLGHARLLTLDGYGHTALLNPSACVERYEVSYFIGGTLPPTGATCHQDQQPFQG